LSAVAPAAFLQQLAIPAGGRRPQTVRNAENRRVNDGLTPAVRIFEQFKTMYRVIPLSLVLAALRFLPSPCAAGDSPAAYDAKFVRMTEVPKKLLAGQAFFIEITMRNTGVQSWGPQNEKHTVLRSLAPENNDTWGTFFITQGQGTTVPVGKEFTFHSWLMAPRTPGEHVFQWRLGKFEGEGYAGRVTMFGEPTPQFTIQVEKRPEEIATPPAPRKVAEKQVLSMDDFEYAGSFKIPDREGHDLPFSHSGLALRKMADGTRRIFFNYTHPKTTLVELDVPPLVRLDDKGGVGQLRTAETKKVWGKLEIKVPKDKLANQYESIWANSGFCWDENTKTLYWTWWDSYWCGNPPPILGASKLAEDGSVTHLGPWMVTPGMYKWYWGGVVRLPQPFAAKYTAGKTLAVGFGTGYSGTYADSHGPSLAAISDPDPKQDSVTATGLLGYYKGESLPRDGRYFIATIGPRGDDWLGKQPDSPSQGYCGSGDLVRSGLFIDTPTKHAFIAFVNLQLGRIGYDYGSGYPSERVNCWYFYDPADLGEAAQGRGKLAIMPRSRADVLPPGEAPRRPSLPNYITGSCFDEEKSLLYVYTFLTGKGRIDAYRLKLDKTIANSN
jgi:hypothetical protein